MKRSRIVFITGTDTGVGKTLLTALLLTHLRRQKCHALGMKPFCSGGRSDVNLIRAAQDRELTLQEINPFYFPEPVAPLVSGRLHGTLVSLEHAVGRIHELADRCDCLLVEGSGGLLVPLGEGYTVRDLIAQLSCEVVVVARNKLGTINHTLLTLEALEKRVGRSGQPNRRSVLANSAPRTKVVLMGTRQADPSVGSNSEVLSECVAPAALIGLPFLGPEAQRFECVKKRARKFPHLLQKIIA